MAYITSSYRIRLKDQTGKIKATVGIYRQALSMVIPIVAKHWDEVETIEGMNQRVAFCEKLIHSTKANQALYPEFDQEFYKFPSYLRRALLRKVIGIVSSYRSNHANWVENGQEGGEPQLQLHHKAFPTLFRGDMIQQGEENQYLMHIKVYHKHDWVWTTVRLRKSDVDYLARRSDGKPLSAPTLEMDKKGFSLRFAFDEEVTYAKKAEVILAVDLGITTNATVVAMRLDGTILGREFISHPREKDQMNRLLNRIKGQQRKGNRKNSFRWSLAKDYNRSIAFKTAAKIVDLAQQYGAQVIVFEFLDTKGKKKGSMKQRLSLWNYGTVFHTATHKAHCKGIRVARVCAWSTSRLAFDGSGKVLRGREIGQPYNLVQFQNGKLYNADLNAAYNIGARYCIRQLTKSLSARKRSKLKAKVPQVFARSTCTLSDLLSLTRVLGQAQSLPCTG